MGLEIERKFLVDTAPGAWPSALAPTKAWAIRQGYLTPPGADPEVRIRLARPVEPGTATARDTASQDLGEQGDAAVVRRLTTKASSRTGDGGAVTRIEVEVDLDATAFDELWGVTADRRIEKVRVAYGLDGGAELTVDHFAGRLRGLVLAEIEFEDAAASRAFDPPAFLRTEVSGDRRYRNAELAGMSEPPAGSGDDDAPAPASGDTLSP